MIKKKSFLALLLVVGLLMSSLSFATTASALDENVSLSYDFSTSTAGYAQGAVTLTSQAAGSYYLYWADDTASLKGYFPITCMTVSANVPGTFNFTYHTAIPADATKIIAVKTTTPDATLKKAPESVAVTSADAVYNVPANMQFPVKSDQASYTFGAYSDIHIDEQYYGSTPSYGFYQYAEQHWADALDYSTKQNQDFIVTSGDNITNAAGFTNEFKVFNKIFAESDFTGYLWEASGNHEIKVGGVANALNAFSLSSGLDSKLDTIKQGKGYYYEIEPNTGDVYINMALETSSSPNNCDEFSVTQQQWVQSLLDRYYGSGVNVFLIQHALIGGWGAGDSEDDPYYGGSLNLHYASTAWFQSILTKYKDIIWMAGHTHENLTMGYNYSDRNGKACNMMHIPSCAGPTNANDTDHTLDYTFYSDESQGYTVQVFGDQVIFNGVNTVHEKIYPAYSYIMTGSGDSVPSATNATEPITTTPIAATSPSEDDTTRTIYFSNVNKWAGTDICYYYWNTGSVGPQAWPGAMATLVGKDANGNDLYKAVVPKTYTNLIFNNGGNGKQTVDIALADAYNWYSPTSTDAACTVSAGTLDESKIVSSVSSKAPVLSVGSSATELNTLISTAQSKLTTYSTYCSYNQYQDVKALVYKYSGKSSSLSSTEVDEAYASLTTALKALSDICDALMGTTKPDVTIYSVVPQAWVDAGYTIKANANTSSAGSWVNGRMYDTGNTYKGLHIYSYTFGGALFSENGVYDLQIQGYDSANTWMGQFKIYGSTFTNTSVFSGKMWYSTGTPANNSVTTGSWVNYTFDETTESTSASTAPSTAPTATEKVLVGILGDPNQDDEVNINDGSAIQRYAAELITFTDDQKLLADTNADGYVNIKDTTEIQLYLAEYDVNEPIGSEIYKSVVTTIPTQASSQTDPTQASSQTDPTQAPSSVESSQASSQTEPTEAPSSEESSQASSQTEPTQAPSSEESSQASSQTEPTESETVTYYFTNNYAWSKVYAYSWYIDGTESVTDAVWPGNAMTFANTNSMNQDIYSISVPKATQYIIFTNNNGSQTVNVLLSEYTTNGFYISGGESATLTVGSYAYSSEPETTASTAPTESSSVNTSGYDEVTLYYVSPSSYQADTYSFKSNLKTNTATSTGVYYPHSAVAMVDTGYTYKGSKIFSVTYSAATVAEYDGTYDGLSKIQLQTYNSDAYLAQYAITSNMTLSSLNGKMFYNTTAAPTGTVNSATNLFIDFAHD